MLARPDLAGVTSFVRAGHLKERCYRRLLHLFHSAALKLDGLTVCWIRLSQRLFTPVRVSGYRLCVADGLKVPKEGKKMPAVKSLHVSSTDNSKAMFVMGHSFQAISMLVEGAAGHIFAVPLLSRVTEGLVLCNAHKRTILDRFLSLFSFVCDQFKDPLLLVADAYYASGKIIRPIVAAGHHLITRAKSNAVAYEPIETKPGGRGRPRKYGKKLKVSSLFDDLEAFTEAPSPVYGESNVMVRYRSVDLLWRPVGALVRFVLVIHPTRGRVVLMCSSLLLEPLTVLRVYGLRFKIELGFKQAIRTLGAYGYHFWMMNMTPIRRKSGDQHLHRKSVAYREAVQRKVNAYHRYVQIGCIVQGLLQHLAVNFQGAVWTSFRSWLRTMNPDRPPSELVTAMALRTALPDFLRVAPSDDGLKKMILMHTDPEQTHDLLLAA
jgi:hypothetical protein